MKIAIAQINTTVGDFSGNSDKIINSWLQADELGAEIVVFPELALCGYPPRDLLLKKNFLIENELQMERLTKKVVKL